VAAGGGCGLDAYLSKIFTNTPSVDSLLQKLGLARTVSVDSLLQKLGLPKTASLDAILFEITGGIQTVSLDADLQKLGLVRTLGTDAYLLAQLVRDTSLDAALNAAGLTKTSSIDSYLYRSAIGSVVVNALLQGGSSRSASIDAWLLAYGLSAIDALLNKTGVLRSAALDGLLSKGLYQVPVLDACLERIGMTTGQREPIALWRSEERDITLSHSKPMINLANPRRVQ